MNTFGDRLKILLKSKGLKSTFLAIKTNKANATISNYITDRSFPNEDFFRKLEEFIPDANLHWLLTGRGEMLYKQEEVAPKVEESRVSTLEEQLAEMRKQQDAIMMAFSGLTNLSKNTSVTAPPVNEYRRNKTKLGSFSGAVHLTGNRRISLISRGYSN